MMASAHQTNDSKTGREQIPIVFTIFSATIVIAVFAIIIGAIYSPDETKFVRDSSVVYSNASRGRDGFTHPTIQRNFTPPPGFLKVHQRVSGEYIILTGEIDISRAKRSALQRVGLTTQTAEEAAANSGDLPRLDLVSVDLGPERQANFYDLTGNVYLPDASPATERKMAETEVINGDYAHPKYFDGDVWRGGVRFGFQFDVSEIPDFKLLSAKLFDPDTHNQVGELHARRVSQDGSIYQIAMESWKWAPGPLELIFSYAYGPSHVEEEFLITGEDITTSGGTVLCVAYETYFRDFKVALSSRHPNANRPYGFEYWWELNPPYPSDKPDPYTFAIFCITPMNGYRVQNPLTVDILDQEGNVVISRLGEQQPRRLSWYAYRKTAPENFSRFRVTDRPNAKSLSIVFDRQPGFERIKAPGSAADADKAVVNLFDVHLPEVRYEDRLKLQMIIARSAQVEFEITDQALIRSNRRRSYKPEIHKALNTTPRLLLDKLKSFYVEDAAFAYDEVSCKIIIHRKGKSPLNAVYEFFEDL